jgi:hypothetical protein
MDQRKRTLQARAVQRRRGVNLDATFKEIPIE